MVIRPNTVREDTQKMSHTHEIQPSQGTESRRLEEHPMTKQKLLMKTTTHEQRRTSTEKPSWKGQKKSTRGLNRMSLASSLTLKSDVAANYKHIFGPALTNLTHLCLASHSIKRTMANSVDPDQTPQNAASDQGIHC